MSRLLLVVLAVLLVASGCAAKTPSLSAPKVRVDTPALRALKRSAGIETCQRATAPVAQGGLPDVTVPCLGGGPSVHLARLRGPLVVNLWAQSCGPCREEMPHLETFSKKYAGRVRVLGVDYLDSLPALALGFAKKVGATYPMVSDLSDNIRTPGLPTTILVDAQGRIVFKRAFPVRSVSQLEQLVRTHLGVS